MKSKFLVIEVKKGTSAGHNNPHYIVANRVNWGYEDDNEFAEVVAKNWAENDPNGQNNGYTLSWSIVTDKTVIALVVNNEFRRLKQEVKSLNENITSITSWSEKNDIYLNEDQLSSDYLINEGYEILECPKCGQECKPVHKTNKMDIVYEKHKCIPFSPYTSFARRYFLINESGEIEFKR